MSRQEELSQVIAGIRRSIPELTGVMIASNDGLAIAHDFPAAESDRIAAMAATALGLGQRVTERSDLGQLAESVFRGERGYLVVYSAGDQAVLVLAGPSTSNLGLMRLEARAASARIQRSLQ
ncbi:MAG: roadblock/LC7 domain-containing protein [Pseudoclavibacter sp.]|nr:roadblock/LC7 domain-containing protein [Pseudoclavibacter sp.]